MNKTGDKRRASKLSVWTCQVYRVSDGFVIEGVIVKGRPQLVRDDESAVRSFFKIIRNYFKRPAKFLKIELVVSGDAQELITDDHGRVEHFFPKDQIGDDIQFLLGGNTIEILNYHVPAWNELFLKSHTVVISDIDDTILVSHSAKIFSRLWQMLAKPAHRRKVVPESEKAYHLIGDANVPVAYVSASEFNLFLILKKFFHFQGLPGGPLLLRPYAHWSELLSKQGRGEYKLLRISNLIDRIENGSIILIGDDSQSDPQIFLELSQKYSAVKSVYIRQTAGEKKEEIVNLTAELDSSISAHYYSKFSDIESSINKAIHENTSRR